MYSNFPILVSGAKHQDLVNGQNYPATPVITAIKGR